MGGHHSIIDKKLYEYIETMRQILKEETNCHATVANALRTLLGLPHTADCSCQRKPGRPPNSVNGADPNQDMLIRQFRFNLKKLRGLP